MKYNCKVLLFGILLLLIKTYSVQAGDMHDLIQIIKESPEGENHAQPNSDYKSIPREDGKLPDPGNWPPPQNVDRLPDNGDWPAKGDIYNVPEIKEDYKL